jgi:hypothetical protein
LGIIIFLVSIYFLLLDPIATLQVITGIAVAAVCFILGWIGYTLVTTPAPSRLEMMPQPETPKEQAQTQTKT